jgi:hypothetical protein
MDDATGDRVGKVFEIGEVFARDNLRMPQPDPADVHLADLRDHPRK